MHTPLVYAAWHRLRVFGSDYACRMSINPFTLAALATTAVEGLKLRGATDDGSSPDMDQVAAQTSDGTTVRICVPRVPHLLERTRAEAKALSAASAGVRERLPFAIPELLGTAPQGKTEISVWTRLPGTPCSLDDLSLPGLAESIAESIAAIHELPTSIVADAGLPHLSAPRVRQEVLTVFDRAVATRNVPTALLERWERAADNAGLWQFTPTVIHGDLGAAALRRSENAVCGVEGWHALSVGDPARDLAWLLGSADFESVDAAFALYSKLRSGDRFIRARAMLHAELDIARWLLYGVERNHEPTIEDAVGMLKALVERVDGDDDEAVKLEPTRLDTMDLSEVQEMLEGNRNLGVARAGAIHTEDTPRTSPSAPAADAETVPLEPQSDEDADDSDEREDTGEHNLGGDR